MPLHLHRASLTSLCNIAVFYVRDLQNFVRFTLTISYLLMFSYNQFQFLIVLC